MTVLFERAGAAFLRAFLVTFLFAATGILNSPDFESARALSWAALAAAIAAGIRSLQVFVPALSFAAILPQPWAAWVDSFTRAFVGVFLTTSLGWLASPDMATWKAAALAAVLGAVTAGVRAIQGLLTTGEEPKTDKGLKTPATNPQPKEK